MLEVAKSSYYEWLSNPISKRFSRYRQQLIPLSLNIAIYARNPMEPTNSKSAFYKRKN
ncbi:hypothetical protein Trichorick_01848 (plasmid) [Candidatus Trichorickettsia mobilis]|nr:hypothetical protein Trichorick_01848 [Candidatus Trichorickettsia mobilis]